MNYNLSGIFRYSSYFSEKIPQKRVCNGFCCGVGMEKDQYQALYEQNTLTANGVRDIEEEERDRLAWESERIRLLSWRERFMDWFVQTWIIVKIDEFVRKWGARRGHLLLKEALGVDYLKCPTCWKP
jgi:hypothetical protein